MLEVPWQTPADVEVQLDPGSVDPDRKGRIDHLRPVAGGEFRTTAVSKAAGGAPGSGQRSRNALGS